MLRTRFLLLGLLLAYASALLGQTWSADTLYLHGMNLPIPKVDTLVTPLYLLASPLKSKHTPGNKMRTGDWANLDYYNDVGREEVYENLFIRIEWLKKQLGTYNFYYKGSGEPLSEEAFKGITFTKFPTFLKILETYKLPKPSKFRRNLFEVYRWQHPNLHVVAYDKDRGGYYRYRIPLIIYWDPEHPEAFVILE